MFELPLSSRAFFGLEDLAIAVDEVFYIRQCEAKAFALPNTHEWDAPRMYEPIQRAFRHAEHFTCLKNREQFHGSLAV